MNKKIISLSICLFTAVFISAQKSDYPIAQVNLRQVELTDNSNSIGLELRQETQIFLKQNII
jgi:hypothetical protein